MMLQVQYFYHLFSFNFGGKRLRRDDETETRVSTDTVLLTYTNRERQTKRDGSHHHVSTNTI